MSETNGIIQPGVPVRFEWKNFRRGYSDRRGNGVGAVYKIEVEVLAEDWATLETMPRHANGELVMWVTEVESAPEKPKKEPKGPYGALWRELFLSGFVNCPGIREAVEEKRETATEPNWEILHRVFGVGGGTLAVVSPEDIYMRFLPEEFPQISTMVEQAIRKAGEKK